MAATFQVKTEAVVRRGKAPEMLMRVNILPRGGGNRAVARRLAGEFRRHPILGDHITSVRVGSSAVLVYFRPSVQLSYELSKMALERQQSREDPAQLGLFPAA